MLLKELFNATNALSFSKVINHNENNFGGGDLIYLSALCPLLGNFNSLEIGNYRKSLVNNGLLILYVSGTKS